MNPVESSVAEDNDHIAIERFLLESLHNRIGTRFVERGSSALADRFHDQIGIESLVLGQHIGPGHLGDTNGIGQSESLRKGVLENLASCRVGARLENRPETGSHIFFPQSNNSLANRSRVMTKIINHRDVAIRDSANLLAALDPEKRGETDTNFVRFEPSETVDITPSDERPEA